MRKEQLSKKIGNKGIAMISIIIAVAFVSVIGSALLYITYENYQMKVLNLKSKDNFYETDGTLVEVTAALRNTIDKQDYNTIESTLMTKTTVQDPAFPLDPSKTITAYSYDISSVLSTKLGYTLTDVTDTYYTGLGYKKQCTINDDTFYFASSGDVEYDKNDKGIVTYTFKNFKIRQDASSDNGGYVNTVKTDIKLKIVEEGKSTKGKGVGDFAMLMDNNIDVSASQFSHLTLYGDAYFSSYIDDGDNSFGGFPGTTAKTADNCYTKPGGPHSDHASSKPAIFLANDSSGTPNEAKLNIFGDYCVVYGDIVLDGNSTIYLSKGSLIVYGDIIFKGNSTLVCSGSIYQPQSPLPGRLTAPTISVESTHTLKDHLFVKGVDDVSSYETNKITDDNFKHFCTTLGLDNDKTADDGILPHILCDKLKYKNKDGDSKEIDNFYFFKDCNSQAFEKKSKQFNFYGTNKIYYFKNNPSGQQFNSELKDTLAFVACDCKMVQPNLNATILSKSAIKFDVQHGAILTKLGNELFDYLTLVDENDKRYDPDKHEISGFDQVIKALKSDDVIKLGDLFVSDPNAVVNDMLGYSINKGKDKTYSHSISFEKYSKDMDN